MSQSPLISESVWLPLVTVSSDQRAFLFQPGSTTPVAPLEIGRHWHWPYLTSIRAIGLATYHYQVGRHVSVSKNVLGDEPIIAATKDMRLISIEGQLDIQADPDAPDAVLSNLNKHSVNRLIRPLIRSGIRLAVAEYNFDQLSNINKLIKSADQLVQANLAEHGLVVRDLQLHPIKPFNPFRPSQNPESPEGEKPTGD